jgi:hypothetical protein
MPNPIKPCQTELDGLENLSDQRTLKFIGGVMCLQYCRSKQDWSLHSTK